MHCIISNLSFFSRCKYKEVKTSNSAIMIVLMRLFQFKTDFQTPGLTRTQYRAGELFWLCLDIIYDMVPGMITVFVLCLHTGLFLIRNIIT